MRVTREIEVPRSCSIKPASFFRVDQFANSERKINTPLGNRKTCTSCEPFEPRMSQSNSVHHSNQENLNLDVPRRIGYDRGWQKLRRTSISESVK